VPPFDSIPSLLSSKRTIFCWIGFAVLLVASARVSTFCRLEASPREHELEKLSRLLMTTSNGFASTSQGLLADRFPVNSLQQLTLQTGEAVSGRVYCTDEVTGSIVLQKELIHTTLASEIRIVSAASVTQSEVLSEDTDAAVGSVAATPLTQPLPKIQKKALEERERRAIRLAEESLRHINQKVRSRALTIPEASWT
jgi:hypothetical protein